MNLSSRILTAWLFLAWITSVAYADVVPDTMPWRNDPHILIALEKPRMHFQIQKQEPIIVYGDVSVTTCVEYNGGECLPARGFIQTEIESRDL